MTKIVLARWLVMGSLIGSGMAHAAIDTGSAAYGDFASPTFRNEVVDAASGLRWIRASTLSEGEAVGFRVATGQEFATLVQHFGWQSAADLPAGQFRLPTAAGVNWGGGGPYQSYQEIGRARLAFGADASFRESVDSAPNGMGGQTVYGYTDRLISVGQLADGQVGGLFTWHHHYDCAPGGRSCNSGDSWKDEALVGTWPGLVAGASDSANHLTWNAWSQTAGLVTADSNGSGLSYFMVASAVPEPKVSALMLVGLILGGVAMRLRRPV